MNSLPREIVLEIFVNLEDVLIVYYRLELVSKEWNTIARDCGILKYYLTRVHPEAVRKYIEWNNRNAESYKISKPLQYKKDLSIAKKKNTLSRKQDIKQLVNGLCNLCGYCERRTYKHWISGRRYCMECIKSDDGLSVIGRQKAMKQYGLNDTDLCCLTKKTLIYFKWRKLFLYWKEQVVSMSREKFGSLPGEEIQTVAALTKSQKRLISIRMNKTKKLK